MTHAPPEHGSESTPPILLELNGVHWTMQSKSILTDIQLSVSRGDWVAIVGPNGAGKSSLLRCCLGWQTPTQGNIRIHGQPVSQVTPKARAAKMAWLPQHTRLSEPMPVRNVVANARYRFSESQAASLNAVGDALSQMHLERLSNRCWTTHSGGEQQRVNLAALIAQEADIWLLDEPANHLDPTVQQSVLQHLYELWQRGQTLVMITHDLNLLLATVPAEHQARVHVLGLAAGRAQFMETLDSPTLPRHLETLYGVAVEELTAFGRRHWVFGAHS